MKGNINSFETMGLLDGPGIRFVLFLQGCPLRCIYCHNPETWSNKKANLMTVEEVMTEVLKYKDYFNNNGGITVSGGEPLLQSEFVTELFKECKKNSIHTCLDTSGYGNNYGELLKWTDLILLDIKGINEEDMINITSKAIDTKFLKTCESMNKKLWIRHVIMPNINDSEEYILKFKEHIKDIKNVEKIELLGYHSLGKLKYDKMNIEYKLKDVQDMNIDKLSKLSKILLD
jgi:pyruvate formate lyase activating enzyme